MTQDQKDQIVRIAKHALIAGVAALAVTVAGDLKVADFGAYTPIVQAIAAVLIKAGTVLVGL